MAVSKDKLVDVWMNQSDLMWRAIFLTPLLAVSIVVAWYTAFSNNEVFLERITLITGIIILMIQYLVIRRMAQYLDAYKILLKEDFAIVGRPLFGLNGSLLARLIPALVSVALLILLVRSFP